MLKKILTSFFAKRWLIPVLLAVLFVAALGIRLLDLNDLPNDFYMVRQYHSLLLARGLYYSHLPSAPAWQQEMAAAQGRAEGLIEPPIMETLAALTYRFIGERIWVGRVYASLFWLAGGLGLWLLARQFSMRAGGLIAVAYFLFLPFGMTASQAFMPDALMTALIPWSLWALYRWEKRPGWMNAALAGLLTGFAILVKSVAVFPLLGAALGLVISRKSARRIFADPQTWLVAGITALPTIIFYLYGLVLTDRLSGQFGLRFFPALLVDPSFYIRWLFTAAGVVSFSALMISLAGILLFRAGLPRLMLLGTWIGYLLFGLAFPYHFITHEYYHLPLVAIIAVGLLPAADLAARPLLEQGSGRMAAVFAAVVLFGVGMQVWQERNYKVSADYRSEIPFWRDLGEKIGHETPFIQLSGDYGYRLAYFGWASGANWSSTADEALRSLAGQETADFSTTFADKTAGKYLFVITSPSEWERQTQLRQYLVDHYPLVDESDEGYWIFNLQP